MEDYRECYPECEVERQEGLVANTPLNELQATDSDPAVCREGDCHDMFDRKNETVVGVDNEGFVVLMAGHCPRYSLTYMLQESE